VVLAVFALAGLGLFYWPVLSSHFHWLLGELGDTRFNNAVLEHWWALVWKGGDWRSIPMFYPLPGTLAYSDALLLLGPPYVLARAANLAPYEALAGVVALLLLLGYASSAWLFRRVLSLPLWIAALAAFLYAFASIRLIHYGHVQLFAAMFVPVLVGLGIGYARRIQAGQWGSGLAICLGVGLAGLLLTSFYVGYFTVFFVGIAGAALALDMALGGGAGAAPTRPSFRGLLSIGLLGLSLLIAAVPLLSLYLPRYADAGRRPWEYVAQTLPHLVDFVNVGPSNLIWGRPLQSIVPSGRPIDWELTYGVAPALLLLFLATGASLIFLRRRRSWLGAVNSLPGAEYARAMAVAVFVAWTLMVVVDGYSLWRYVYAWVPGASAIRAVFRFQAVLQLGVVCVAAFGLAALWRAAAGSKLWSALVLSLGAFLAIEQVDVGHPLFDRRAESSRLAAWPAPPAYCRHFLLVADPSVDRTWYAEQIDAVLLGLRFGLPTINGYSGDVPHGWELRDPRAPGYLPGAARWVAGHGIAPGLCTLDAATGQWKQVLPGAPDLRRVNLIDYAPLSLEDGLALGLAGFHQMEAGGRWTNGQGRILLSPGVSAEVLRIDGRRGGPVSGPLRVFVNGRLRHEQALPDGSFSIALPLEAPVESIQIDSDSFVPQLLKINQDPRRLGVVISRVVLE